jgi:hypothetical protein
MQIVMHHPGHKNSHLSENFTVWLFELPTSTVAVYVKISVRGTHQMDIYIYIHTYIYIYIYILICVQFHSLFAFVYLHFNILAVIFETCHCEESSFLLKFCLTPRSVMSLMELSLSRLTGYWLLTPRPRFDASEGHILSFLTASREAEGNGHYKRTGVRSRQLAQSCAEVKNVWGFDTTPSLRLCYWTCPDLRQIVFTVAMSKEMNEWWSFWWRSFIKSVVFSSVLRPNRPSVDFVSSHLRQFLLFWYNQVPSFPTIKPVDPKLFPRLNSSSLRRHKA